MNEFNVTRVNGEYGETYVGISSKEGSTGTTEQVIAVPDGTGHLSITLSKSVQNIEIPDGIQLRVTSPDGNVVPFASEVTEAGFYLIVAEQPIAGDWTLFVEASNSSQFQAEARALPAHAFDAAEQLGPQWESLEKFSTQLPGYKEMVEFLDSLDLLGGCQACRVAISIAMVGIGILVFIIAVVTGTMSAKFAPLIIVAAVIAKLGITITAHALASLFISIIGGGNRSVDTVADRLCVAFKACPPR